jgi:hypothetical protein
MYEKSLENDFVTGAGWPDDLVKKWPNMWPNPIFVGT